MGLMDKVMDSFDDEDHEKKKAKDIGKYQEPMSVEDFLSMVEKTQSKKPGAKPRNRKTQAPTGNVAQPSATGSGQISDNKLRPKSLNDFIGQEKAKKQIQTFIDGAKMTGKKYPHTLIATGAGMGKTTLATIIAEELQRPVFVEKAPISVSRLLTLGKMMCDGAILLLDEVHLQAKGRVAGNSPEALYHIMEDGKILTEQGLFNYPDITVIGCTTDRGLLPKSFADRFTMSPPIMEYTTDDMGAIAKMNADALEVGMDEDAKQVFAHASQWTPRVVNNYVRQASYMAEVLSKKDIDGDLAKMVLENQGVELDGLTHQHMQYLNVLHGQLRWLNGPKEWQARGSLKTVTHGMGIHDTKFVEREIEPLLIKLNYIRITTGRELTDKGFERVNQARPTVAP